MCPPGLMVVSTDHTVWGRDNWAVRQIKQTVLTTKYPWRKWKKKLLSALTRWSWNQIFFCLLLSFGSYRTFLEEFVSKLKNLSREAIWAIKICMNGFMQEVLFVLYCFFFSISGLLHSYHQIQERKSNPLILPAFFSETSHK